MVHIELIVYTTYCIVFSTACYLVLKKLYNKRLDELERDHQKNITDLKQWFEEKHKEMMIEQDKALISAKWEVSKENMSYLSQMNKDISVKIKDLADVVKNKPII